MTKQKSPQENHSPEMLFVTPKSPREELAQPKVDKIAPFTPQQEPKSSQSLNPNKPIFNVIQSTKTAKQGFGDSSQHSEQSKSEFEVQHDIEMPLELTQEPIFEEKPKPLEEPKVSRSKLSKNGIRTITLQKPLHKRAVKDTARS